MTTKLLLKSTIILLLVRTAAITAQWSSNSTINNSICTASGTQFQQVAVSDGSGGAIIAWADKRDGTGVGAELNFFDIYAQRINVNGTVQWTANGIPICNATGGQRFPSIISDNNGGAIISWTDDRNIATTNSDIYAQHVSATGTMFWAVNGVSICSKINAQANSAITSDGAGGSIITWEDKRNGTDDNIFAQSINSSGVAQWNLDGILVCNALNNQKNLQIIAAETGQAIITWEDNRLSTSSSNIYAFKINTGGGNAWGGNTTNGVLISAAGSCLAPKLVSDGNFGTIITWYDRRNGVDYNIYAQKIIANGTLPWLSVGGNGIEICIEVGDQVLPQICSDGANGAIITWEDGRQGATSSQIYVQHIDSNGLIVIPWSANGNRLSISTGAQNAPAIVSDGTGSAIVSWNDYRNGVNADIYVQHISANGVALWDNTISGVAVCSEASSQGFATSIVKGNAAEVIIAWQDSRNANFDIYAQKINATGTLANKNVALENQFYNLYPNPTSTGLFFIQSPNNIQSVSAFDIFGKQIGVKQSNNFYQIDAFGGIYMLKITDVDGNSQIKKILIN